MSNFFLKEDGDYLLLETGDIFLLEGEVVLVPPGIPTHDQQKALTIAVFSSILPGGTSVLVNNYVGSQFEGYSHEIQAMGGYWKADFTVKGFQGDVEDWFVDGVGRHIEVYDHALNKIWEGFVDQVDIQMGSLRAVRGPLMEISNRVTVQYQTVTYNTTPPVGGEDAETSVADSAASQAKYGILQTIVNGGTLSSTEAEQKRDNFLTQNAFPATSLELNVEGQQVPSAKISCLGYVHLFKRYVYEQTGSSGTENASDKVTNILEADVNSIFSTNTDRISANTIQVAAYADDNEKAWSLMRDVASQGDASNTRYLTGVYNGRTLVYEAIPSTLRYRKYLSDPAQRVFTVDGQYVYPWNVLPGEWLIVADFLIGKVLPETDLDEDPRVMFIESIRYTAPWGLQLKGGKINDLLKALDGMGLGGTS